MFYNGAPGTLGERWGGGSSPGMGSVRRKVNKRTAFTSGLFFLQSQTLSRQVPRHFDLKTYCKILSFFFCKRVGSQISHLDLRLNKFQCNSFALYLFAYRRKGSKKKVISEKVRSTIVL